MARIDVKICGLKDEAGLAAALAGGAAYVGFVFYPPSPRAIAPIAAEPLAAAAAGLAKRVGLIVNASDIEIATILAATPLDILQLHGDETTERTRQIRARFGLPVIKATPIATALDLTAANAWRDCADMLLFDAKPPAKEGALPGGNARAFDWSLLAAAQPVGPWMLSGGLTPENVVEAIHMTGATAVDVSSGVERTRGEKDPARIAAFLKAADAA